MIRILLGTWSVMFAAAMSLPCYASPDADDVKRILELITMTVKDLCQSPNEAGKYVSIDVGADANLSIKILKLVGVAGAEANADFTQEEWEGVRKVLDQNKENENFRDCVRELTPKFLDKYGPDSVSNSSEPKQTVVADLEWEGGLYSGQLVDGNPSGNGSLVIKVDGKFEYTYEGVFESGKANGIGKASIMEKSGKQVLSGDFEDGIFISGTGSMVYDKYNPLYIRVSEDSSNGIIGSYTGGLRNPKAGDRPARAAYWRDVVPDGKGRVTGKIVADGERPTLTWEGDWTAGALLGRARITFPNGGYEEGEFHYHTLVKGEAVLISHENQWGVFLNYHCTYTGQILNGRPNGEGQMGSNSFDYPLRFTGTFVDGKFWTGFGLKPSRADTTRDYFPFGAVGEWKDGEFWNGNETAGEMLPDGKVLLDTWEFVNGAVTKYTQTKIENL